MKTEQPRVKKKRNWVNDETLHWSEKAFHTVVFGAGIFILGVALRSLWDLAHSSIQGAGTVVLAVVFMLLVVFGFFCISGRGVEVVELLRDNIEKAEYIKLWGFVVKTRLPKEKAK